MKHEGAGAKLLLTLYSSGYFSFMVLFVDSTGPRLWFDVQKVKASWSS